MTKFRKIRRGYLCGALNYGDYRMQMWQEIMKRAVKNGRKQVLFDGTMRTIQEVA